MNHKHLKNNKKINVKINDIRIRLNGSTVVQRFSTTGPWTGSRPLVIPYKAREEKKNQNKYQNNILEKCFFKMIIFTDLSHRRSG